MGLALGGRLLKACLDRGIEPHTSHRGVELIMEDGDVAGVVFETPEGRKEVRAPNVVIATGGFEHNAELKRAFLRGPCTHTVAVETNTGDGLKMAMRVGAMLGNMREAWWMPMIELPTDIVPTGQQLLTYERTLPGAIMVNRAGKRFTNEASNYNAFGAAFHEQDTTMGVYRNLPCWLLFDQTWLEKYGFAGGLGGTEKARTDWITCSDTVGGLADKLDIPADVLEDASSGSTPTRATSTIPTSSGAGALRTSGGATRRSATEPRGLRSGRSRRRPTTRSRSTAARSGPRADRRPTPKRASSTSTATSSPGSTPRGTRWPRRSA